MLVCEVLDLGMIYFMELFCFMGVYMGRVYFKDYILLVGVFIQ